MSSKDLYSILGLSASQSIQYGPQAIKLAYQKSLLVHHPDKSIAKPRSALDKSSLGPVPTVDDILHAYKILSDRHSRAEYDRQLMLESHKLFDRKDHETFRSGLETVDLDDLDYNEATNIWTRSCRCGQRRGFIVTEQELEREMEVGELCVECRGCSLWLKVLFAIDPGDEKNEEQNDDVKKSG